LGILVAENKEHEFKLRLGNFS